MANVPKLWLIASVLVSFAVVEVYSKWVEIPVPEHFSDRNISNYSVRYVSPWGTDNEDCLASQPYKVREGCNPIPTGGQSITYCKTVGYGLVGECLGNDAGACVPDVQQNLVVVVANGSLIVSDNELLVVDNFVNLMLMKAPGCDEELVISCKNFSEDIFNDFYVQNSSNIAVNGLTFAYCGPKSTGMAFRNVYEIVISNSVFRYVTLWNIFCVFNLPFKTSS